MVGFGRVLVLGLVVGSALGFACGKGQKGNDGGPGGGEDTTPPEVFSKMTFNPRLVVTDQAGNAVANATVVFGNLSVKSKEDGSAILPEQASDKSTVVTVSAEGYAPSTKTLSLANAYTALPVELARLLDFTLDAETGGGADLGTTQVRFPGRGFLRADGTPYTGTVTVKAVSLFDGNLGGSDITTGDRIGVGAAGEEPLELFAAIHVEFKAADGGALQFAAGDRAVVSFNLPSEGAGEAGEALSMYRLDQKTGRWHEGSSCAIRDMAAAGQPRTLACVGDVEHFSVWGVGRFRPRNFCRKFALKVTHPFPSSSPLKSWAVQVKGWPSLCSFVKPSTAAPQGTCTLSSYVPGRPQKVWVEAIIATSWFRYERQFLPLEVSGSYDGSCPETVLHYNPNSRTLGLDAAPPDKLMPVDKDGDGYFARSGETLVAGEDCDDDNKEIFPGARPVPCTGKDHDCDGRPDLTRLAPNLSALPDLLWNQYCAQSKMTCSAALKQEVPGNQRDEDCDGFVSDGDGDGYFRRSDPLFAASGKAADCNDYHAGSHPGGVEVKGNLYDENCDGVAADQDGDGFLSAKELALEGMSQTTGAVDCNDLDKDAHPGSTVTDLPVLATFYEGGKRKAEFCGLFDATGKPSAKLEHLFFVADRNCNGVLEDLDGDGKLVAAAGSFANTPPYDANDLDPRVQTKGQTGSPNDKDCAADLENFGGGARQVCPRLFNRNQQCVDTERDGQPTGEYACGSPDWNVFSIPPDPFAFGRQYGPCSTMVLPDCGGQSLCGGPIQFAPWYKDALKKALYDVSSESFTGFCMPACAEAK